MRMCNTLKLYIAYCVTFDCGFVIHRTQPDRHTYSIHVKWIDYNLSVIQYISVESTSVWGDGNITLVSIHYNSIQAWHNLTPVE